MPAEVERKRNLFTEKEILQASEHVTTAETEPPVRILSPFSFWKSVQ
jgi:hypothetical protein